MTPERELAEKIHEKLCYSNHTDGCGWCYETWEDPSYTKKEYLAKAKAILNVVGIEDALKVVECLSVRIRF